MIKMKFSARKFFFNKIEFCKHYYSPLNTFTRIVKDPGPYLWLIDPDPGGPRTYGSGNRALHFRELKMKTTRDTADFAEGILAYQDCRKYGTI